MQYLDNEEDCAGIARAVAPLLIAHGRELEKAEVVAWLRNDLPITGSPIADAIERNEHRSKPWRQ